MQNTETLKSFLKKKKKKPLLILMCRPLLTFWYKSFQDFFLLKVAFISPSLSKYKIIGFAK